MKVYVATADESVLEDEHNRFHFRIEELHPEGMAETARYDAIFHAPGTDEEED